MYKDLEEAYAHFLWELHRATGGDLLFDLWALKEDLSPKLKGRSTLDDELRILIGRRGYVAEFGAWLDRRADGGNSAL